MKKMNKTITRWVLYLAGMIILAFGIILNTKSNLGVSPIISVAFVLSQVFNLNFGDVTLGWYTFFIVVEIIIHLYQGKKNLIIPDLLQFPVSIIVTRFMNLFSANIPVFSGVMSFVILALGILFTGIGAALSLNARLVPNPGDGIVQAIADLVGKSVGDTKNVFDICCVITAVMISFLCFGEIRGLGIGTVCAMLGVGRVIAVYNRMFKVKTDAISGIESL